MIENRGKKAGFCDPKRRRKKSEGPKNRCTKTIFFEINRFERAPRAKKKNACICLEMGIVARRRRAFLFFGTDLAGPVRQEDV